MTLETYINNPALAYASEIFNANANSAEEMMTAITKATEAKAKLEVIMHKYSVLYEDIIDVKADMERDEANLLKLHEFANSTEAKLIADFIQNGNANALEEIKSMITVANPFDIHIIPAWQRGDGERAYGLPLEECFVLDSPRVWYKFDNFDLSDDIQRHERRINRSKQTLQELYERRSEMLAEHGDCLSSLDDGGYEDYLYEDEEW
jgi:hypothetical protein